VFAALVGALRRLRAGG